VDVILAAQDLARFKEAWLGRGYVNVRAGGKPVRDTQNDVRIVFLLSSDFPGDGKPKPVAVPRPAEASEAGERYHVLSLPRLIELKLASGMTAPHRLRDLADVLELVRVRSLPKQFADQLDPYVRTKYDELWHAAQHPDEEY
jgi:hypothetical protein